jgi:hypothetical protein
VVCVLTKRELRSLYLLADRLKSQGLVAESRTLQDILRLSTGQREVRASTAAEILHVTSQTVRNWVKSGKLAGRIDKTGHVFVDVEALRPTIEIDAALPALPPDAQDVDAETINAEVRALRAERRGS